MKKIIIVSMMAFVASYSAKAVLATSTKENPEYVIEANEYEDRCLQSSTLSSHFDCKCMRGEFLEHRIAIGNNGTSSSAELKVSSWKCLSKHEMVEYKTSECLQRQNEALPTDKGVHLTEEYCQCMPQAYAILMKAAKTRFTSKVKISLSTQAEIICSDPESAKNIYPKSYSTFINNR